MLFNTDLDQDLAIENKYSMTNSKATMMVTRRDAQNPVVRLPEVHQ